MTQKEKRYRGYIGNGRYGMIDPIGNGGFAEVYLARDFKLNRLVAIKALNYILSLSNTLSWLPTVPNSKATFEVRAEERFYQEAEKIASLPHPNHHHVIEVYDSGRTEKSDTMFPGEIRPYMVMQYAAKGDLSQHITGKIFAPEVALRILDPIADALDFVYEAGGIIHMDPKPHNVLVTEDETLLLTDFGISSVANQLRAVTSPVATPAYSSPERYLIPGYIAHRTADVFSLGVIAYGLLCGVTPHQSKWAEEYKMLYADPHYTLPSFASKGVRVDPRVEAIVRKALAFNPEERYQTCRAFIEDLRAVCNQPAQQVSESKHAEDRHRLEARIRELEEQVRAYQKAAQRAGAVERQRDDLQEQLNNLQWEQQRQKREAKQAVTTRVRELQERLNQAQQSIRDLNHALQQQQQFTVQESAFRELQNRLQQSTQLIQQLVSEKTALEQQLQTLDEMIPASELEQYARQNQSLERSIRQLQTGLAQANTQISALVKNNTGLQKMLEEQRQRNKQLLVDNQAMQQYQAQLLAAYRSTVQKTQRLETSLRDVEQQLRPLANAEERAEFAERQLAALQEQLRTLQVKQQLTASDYSKQGCSLLGSAQYEEALNAFNQSLTLRPNNVETLTYKGRVLASLGQFQEALRTCDRALAIRPDYVEALYLKGDSLRMLGEHQEAFRIYDRARELHPGSWYVLGIEHNRILPNDIKPVTFPEPDVSEKANQAWHTSPQYYVSLGHKLYEQRYFKEAISHYDQAIRISPRYAYAYNLKGHALAELGEYREAITCYDQAIKLGNTMASTSKKSLLRRVENNNWPITEDSEK